MKNLNEQILYRYLKEVKNQYSGGSVRRKYASLRKFLDYLNSAGHFEKEKLAELKRAIRARQYPNQTSFEIKAEPIAKKSKSPEIQLNNGAIEQLSNDKNKNILITAILIALFTLSINLFTLGKASKNITQKLSEITPNTQAKTEKEIFAELSINALLKDNFEIPLNYEQEISFSIYTSKTEENPIYSTGRCSIFPDEEGSFEINIGKDCGQPINYSIFTVWPQLYLGTSLGFGKELIPRFPVKKLDFEFNLPTPALTPSPPPEITIAEPPAA